MPHPLNRVLAQAEKHPELVNRAIRSTIAVAQLRLTRLSEHQLHHEAPSDQEVRWNTKREPLSHSLSKALDAAQSSVTQPTAPNTETEQSTTNTAAQTESLHWAPKEERLSPELLLKILNQPITQKEAEYIFHTTPRWSKHEEMLEKHKAIVGKQLLEAVSAVSEFDLERIIKLVVNRLPDQMNTKIFYAWKYYDDAKIDPNSIAKELQEQSQEKERPLTFDEILPLFIQQSNGNVAQALSNAGTFFRRWTRPSSEGLSDSAHKNLLLDRAEWMSQFIQDQISPVQPFNSIEADEPAQPEAPKKTGPLQKVLMRLSKLGEHDFDPRFNLENQIGVVYHSYYLLSLLEDVTPEAIMLLTSMEHLKYGYDHGVNKILADMMMLQELKAAEQLLSQLPKE